MTNELLNARLFAAMTTALTQVLLQKLREKHDVESAVFLIDGAQDRQTVLRQARIRFQIEHHRTRNAVERIFRELKRRTSRSRTASATSN